MSEQSGEKDAVGLSGHAIVYRAHRYECLRCGARLMSMMQFNGRECPHSLAAPTSFREQAVTRIFTQEDVAQAWDEGYTSGHSNAMRRMSDEPNAPTPYRPLPPEASTP